MRALLAKLRYLIVALSVLGGSYLLQELPIAKQLFKTADLRIYDTILDFHYALSESKNMGAYEQICIVDIDEKSIATLGQFSTWPTLVFADVIDIISSDEPLAIGMDVFFTERDTLSPYTRKRLAEQLQGLGANPDNIVQHLSTDSILASSLERAGNVYLGMFNSLDTPSQRALPATLTPWKVKPKSYIYTDYPHPPTELLASTAKGVGFADIEPDESGIIHDYPLFLKHQVQHYVNFSFQMGLDLMAIDSISASNSCNLFSGRKLIQSIPLSPEGLCYFKFYGPQKSFRYIPFSDVLQRKLPPTYFKDRVILIGSSASGLRDLLSVPLDAAYPGVELHATFLRNLLEADFVSWLDPQIIFAINVLLMIIMAFLIKRFKPYISIIGFLALIMVMLWGFYFIYATRTITLPYTQVLLPLVSGFTAFMITEAHMLIKDKKKVLGAFEHYVSKDVISEIMKGKQALQTGGEKKQISVLFADVRNFTSLCEKMSPPELTGFMNRWFNTCTNLITENHGMLDKYIGDAVLALFGAPLSTPHHEQNAVQTALAIHEHSLLIAADYADHPHLKNFMIGIGIASEELIVGNIGSDSIFNYTALGDKMNTGSRLEELNKFYHTAIIIDEATYSKVKDLVHCRRLDTVIVKGKQLKSDIFEVINAKSDSKLSPDILESHRLYEIALNQIQNKLPDAARSSLIKALELNPGDYPSKIMLERLDIINWEAWNGVWGHYNK